MNAERIADLRSLHENTTKPPWTKMDRNMIVNEDKLYESDFQHYICECQYQGDTAFIAAAHSAIPELLDEIERLQKMMDSMKRCENCKNYTFAAIRACRYCRPDEYIGWELR